MNFENILYTVLFLTKKVECGQPRSREEYCRQQRENFQRCMAEGGNQFKRALLKNVSMYITKALIGCHDYNAGRPGMQPNGPTTLPFYPNNNGSFPNGNGQNRPTTLPSFPNNNCITHQPNIMGPNSNMCNSLGNLLGNNNQNTNGMCDLSQLNYGNMINSFMKKPKHCNQSMNCVGVPTACISNNGNMGNMNGGFINNGMNGGFINGGMHNCMQGNLNGGINGGMNNNCMQGNMNGGMMNCNTGMNGGATTLPFNPCVGLGSQGSTFLPGGIQGGNSDCATTLPVGCYDQHNMMHHKRCHKKHKHGKRKHKRHSSSSS